MSFFKAYFMILFNISNIDSSHIYKAPSQLKVPFYTGITTVNDTCSV